MGSKKNPSQSGHWGGFREGVESMLSYFGQQCHGGVALFSNEKPKKNCYALDININSGPWEL